MVGTVSSSPFTRSAWSDPPPQDIETGCCGCSCLPGLAPRQDEEAQIPVQEGDDSQTPGQKMKVALYVGAQGGLRDGINQLGGQVVASTIKSGLKSLSLQSPGWATGVAVTSGVGIAVVGGCSGWRGGELIGHGLGYKDNKRAMMAFKVGGAALGACVPVVSSLATSAPTTKLAQSLGGSFARMLGQVTRDFLNQAQRGAWGSMKVTSGDKSLSTEEMEIFDTPRLRGSTMLYAGMSVAHQLDTKAKLTGEYGMGDPSDKGLSSFGELFRADMGTVTSSAALEALDTLQASTLTGLRAVQTGKELEYVKGGGFSKVLENLGILADAWSPAKQNAFSAYPEGHQRDTKIREMGVEQRQETWDLATSHASMRVLGGAFPEVLLKAAATCEEGSGAEKALLGLSGVLNGLTEYRGYLVGKGLLKEAQQIDQAANRLQTAVFGWSGCYIQLVDVADQPAPAVMGTVLNPAYVDPLADAIVQEQVIDEDGDPVQFRDITDDVAHASLMSRVDLLLGTNDTKTGP